MRKGLILSAWLAIVPVWSQGSIDPSGVRLDHMPLAVRDLPAAVAQFSRLGFTIKPGRHHQNGIENASIKFADGSYVELITSHDASDEISREYQEFLRKQEGVAYVFVRDEAVTRVTSQVLQAGGHRAESGPFAFTEVPAAWKAPHLQLIEYFAPANDSPATYQHSNGASRIVAIWTIVEHSDDPVVKAFGARPRVIDAWAFNSRETEAVALGGGACLMFATRTADDPPQSAALGILIEVGSLRQLTQSARSSAVMRGPAAWLSPSQMHGVWLGFIEHAAWAATRCLD
jgi:hypothetical protein